MCPNIKKTINTGVNTDRRRLALTLTLTQFAKTESGLVLGLEQQQQNAAVE